MIIEFNSKIWYWRGPAPFYFVTVPPEQSEVLAAISEEVTYGWGMIPVYGQINATRWKTSLFPKDGGYIVPIKDMVRTAESLDKGDEVTIQLTIRD